MYQVLVAVDEDADHAELLARVVARLPNAERSVEATVLYVFENVEAPPAAAIQELPRRDTDDTADDRLTFPESVERARTVLEDAGVSHRVCEERGDPDEEILTAADDLSVDAIYIGGKNRSPSGKILFGSVVQDVLFGTDRPVTIIGSRGRKLFG